MVHGRTAYIVACGPRTKGAKPGSVSVCCSPFRSAAVYSGLTRMPSGVTQSSASSWPPGADLAAACAQAASAAASAGFLTVSVMALSRCGTAAQRLASSVAQNTAWKVNRNHLAARPRDPYIMHNYKFKTYRTLT